MTKTSYYSFRVLSVLLFHFFTLLFIFFCIQDVFSGQRFLSRQHASFQKTFINFIINFSSRSRSKKCRKKRFVFQNYIYSTGREDPSQRHIQDSYKRLRWSAYNITNRVLLAVNYCCKAIYFQCFWESPIRLCKCTLQYFLTLKRHKLEFDFWF